MRHLMSTLIRLQFSPCYLDSEIPESCRGGGYISQLQDVVGLGNLDYCLMSQKTIAKRSFITFILVKHTTQFLVLVSSAKLTFSTAMQLILYIKRHLQHSSFSKQIIIGVWGFVLIGVISHLTPYHHTPLL